MRRRLAAWIPTRPGEGLESAPTRPIHRGASGNAPGSGSAELTKLEIRPDLDHDEIAGWRRRGHRDADARRGARILSRSLGASLLCPQSSRRTTVSRYGLGSEVGRDELKAAQSREWSARRRLIRCISLNLT